MLKVDRRDFVDDPLYAYADSPQSIKYGATISAPHMHAFALVLIFSICIINIQLGMAF